jgi:hypothetical protein
MKDLLLPLACALLLAACAQHRLVVARPDPTGQPITANSSALGWVAKQKRTVADCPTNLLAEVRVHQNLLQALATVATLGAWMPTKFEYRCAKVPSQPPGGFDEPEPPR